MPARKEKMSNTIDYAKLYQTNLDEKMVQDITSKDLEAGAGEYKYTGGNEVKILKMTLDGLADYSRATGFSDGDIVTSYETHTFDMDRGRSFQLDAMDNDEAGSMDLAGKMLSTFQKEKVGPEIDAYRYSYVFDKALDAEKSERYTADTSTIFEKLTAHIAAVQDIVGETEPLMIYMSFVSGQVLDNADKIVKQLVVSESNNAGIATKIRSLNGVPIVMVPSLRFKTEYDFGSDGFTAADYSSAINWLIVAKRSVVAISKQDKVRIFTPDQNQNADAYKFQYRKYHTVIVPDNKVDGLYACYAGAAAPALSATVAAAASTVGATKFTATAGAGNTLGYVLGAASPGVKYLDLIDNFTGSVEPYTSAADIAATADQYLTMCEVNGAGRVVKVLEHILEAGDIKSS